MHPVVIKLGGVDAVFNVIRTDKTADVIAVEFAAELAMDVDVGSRCLPSQQLIQIHLDAGLGISHPCRTVFDAT